MRRLPLARPVHFRTIEEPDEWVAITTAFLRRHVEEAGAQGVVLGLSGGLDSSVVAALAARALGAQNVTGYILPAPDSDPQDKAHALLVAKHVGIEAIEVPLAPILAGVEAVLKQAAAATPGIKSSASKQGAPTNLRAILGNAKSRTRMMVLYAQAQAAGRLVCGTGNKSEFLTGYFTKHGDGGADLQPIGDLYKTQVFRLARHLGLPEQVIDKPPSAGLHAGQTDEDDMGVRYEDLDRILKGFELNQGVDEVAQRTGLAHALVVKVDGMVRRSEHKRHLALIPKIGARTVGLDWRRSVHGAASPSA